MVGVEEAPASPLPGGHDSKNRMGGEGGEVWIGEAMEGGKEDSGVGRELGGWGAGEELVHFRPGGVISGPRKGKAKGDELENCRGQRCRARAGGSFPEREAERVVQMANHLIRTHAAPAPGGGGGEAVEAVAGSNKDPRAEECFHKKVSSTSLAGATEAGQAGEEQSNSEESGGARFRNVGLGGRDDDA